MHDDTPDYASYSLADLYDVRRRINREKFPERFAAIMAEIERRERDPQLQQEQVAQARLQKRAGFVRKARWSGGLFVFFGSLLANSGCVQPVLTMIRINSWPAVSCVIAHRQRVTRRNKHIETFITFRYSFDGQSFVGRRLSSAPYVNTEGWRQAYPNGTRSVCFVNPDFPQEAVLTRGRSLGVMFVAAFFAALSALFLFNGFSLLRRPENAELDGKTLDDI